MINDLLGMGLLLALGCGALVPPARAQAALPDGEGKAQVERVCTACHTLDTVTAAPRTREDWTMVIEDMQTRGAQGSDRDFIEIVNYLSTHFGPNSGSAKSSEAPKDESKAAEIAPATEADARPSENASSKININKATAKELASELKISQESASAIVRYREAHGAIKNWDVLKAIPTLDLHQLEHSKERIEF